MRKCLFISTDIQINPQGGREKLTKLHYDILLELYGPRLNTFRLKERSLQKKSMIYSVLGYIDGLSIAVIGQIVDFVADNGITEVFIDGSNLGVVVDKIKKKCRHTHVYVLFHNVESRFFLGAFLENISFHSLGVLIANYFAEFYAVKSADHIITLSKRDSLLLHRLYGRSAHSITPISLDDTFNPEYFNTEYAHKKEYALFVGGTFYANQQGIAWFVKNVVPYIDIMICIVGKGFEDFRDKLEIPGKVEVIGTVDSLAEWYCQAKFIIAPIFDGSGMKTKVAESLMFGKKVVGTPEAFSGYEDCASIAGWCCSTVNDFILAMNEAQKINIPQFDEHLRNIFIENYSLKAASKRLHTILNDNVLAR